MLDNVKIRLFKCSEPFVFYNVCIVYNRKKYVQILPDALNFNEFQC